MSDLEPRPRRDGPTGFSTLAIRAVSRVPRPDQRPTSVPIYQTATFAQHEVAVRQFRPGVAGGMLAFEVAGGREAGRAIIDHLTLPERTASLGSVHTMVVHPPSTSQRQMSEDELLQAGITPGLLRVSVGLEDVEDLEADLAAARTVAPSNDPAPAVV